MTYVMQTLNPDTWKKIVQSQRTDKRTSKIHDISGISPQIHEWMNSYSTPSLSNLSETTVGHRQLGHTPIVYKVSQDIDHLINR